ncbi:hypothetical protein [Euzebya rosea]|uniref:hypothetical protein n=1 Tax=Euzebya rosea TaxID=2052804 RepID=UPI000D3E075F|nr:hypothetical protein [Euzebya rosea]
MPSRPARVAGGDQPTGHRRAHDDRGFVTAEWMVGVALLVVPTLLVIAVLPSWAARHETVAVAAREGARAAAAATDAVTARAAAARAAMEVLDRRGLPTDEATVTVDLPSGPTLPRDGQVRVRVVLPTAPVTLPGGGTVDGPSVTGEHARALDPYRGR